VNECEALLPGRQKIFDGPAKIEYKREESMTDSYARIREARAKSKRDFEAREKGGIGAAFSKLTAAIDFQV
jgi:hypothetical protein